MTTSPTTDIQPELLPCPFCGGEAKRFTIEEEGDNFGGDVIACTGMCGASSHVEFGRKENLVSLWNTRLTSTTPTLGDVVMEVVELARRDIAREQTDFLGRMGQALCTYEGIFDQYPDGDLPDDDREEADDQISALAGMALAQLALLRHPIDGTDPAAMLAAAPASPIPTSVANEGEREDSSRKWRERWYGSEPQRGSAIVDEAGNLVAHFGGDETTHAATTATVAAHNEALSPALDNTAVEAASVLPILWRNIEDGDKRMARENVACLGFLLREGRLPSWDELQGAFDAMSAVQTEKAR